MKVRCYLFAIVMIASGISYAQKTENKTYRLLPFGNGGQVKMIYDRRQRPQAVLMGNEIHLVYNGGAPAETQKPVKTLPYITTYNLQTNTFSESIELPGEPSKDHHYGPIIWADNNNFLHVLSACHKTPGTHVISSKPNSIGTKTEDWKRAPQIRHSLSYPTVYSIYDNKKLIYFRTGEHRSAWTYLISDDKGRTWKGPENDVVDLNKGGETPPENNTPGMEEWSSYQTCLPSKNGRFLHVAFCFYDDNKKDVPEKYYNPRYKTSKNLNLKYNLYYVKINLDNHELTNFKGEVLKAPIDLELANAKCKIWDTNWRGAGIPPDIIIDENDNPAFLHVLSEDNPKEFNYYYVRFDKKEWRQTAIAPSCHKWNSSLIQIDKNGVLHAYLLMDDTYFESKGKGVMNSYGGGTRIEEWVSKDKGNTWTMKNTLLKAEGEYTGWRFNNIQAIKNRAGNSKEGMFLFYGWKEKNAPQAKAFLLIENNVLH